MLLAGTMQWKVGGGFGLGFFFSIYGYLWLIAVPQIQIFLIFLIFFFFFPLLEFDVTPED